jgi:endonuclease/exonuclease/phosphatase family metal-dependent hydrolase
MIHLITLNTWKCDGDYFNRLEVIYRGLKKEGDIILLQESFQSIDGKHNTAGFLAEKLNFNVTSSQSRRKERKLMGNIFDSYSNVSILSKYPIINSYIISLPSNDKDGGREAIGAEISLNDRKILVISVHLSHLSDSNDLRKEQLQHIINQPFFSFGYDAIFIGGDFNQIITDELLTDLQQSGFNIKDTHNGFEKVGNDYTFTNGKVYKKIDHILQLSLNEKPTPQVVDSTIVFNETDIELGIKASDHNGVMISVEI